MADLIVRKKLYLIGVDSAPLWLIEKLQKKHGMHGFEKFAKEGMLRNLESTLPPVTAAAWPSIYTGLEPGEHGVMDFLCIDSKYSKQLIYYDPSKFPPFWDTLAKKGLRSLVITPAMSLQKSPSDNVDIITGWPLQPRYSSKELEDAAKEFGFKGEPEIGLELEKGEMSVEQASKRYLRSIKARSELSKYLIHKNDYDLVFVCFTETDRIQHYALSLDSWEKSVAPLYKSISDFVEWVMDYTAKEKENSMVMLVSDHGAQPIKNKFLINAWLVQNGFAKLKGDVKTKSASGIGTSVRKQIRERVMKIGIRRAVYNAMPGALRKMVERLVDEIPDEQYIGGQYRKIYETDFDMRSTKAFAAISFGTIGMIWLNDKRFSSQGIDSSEIGRVKEAIISALKGLKSAEGDKLVIGIYDGKRYYGNRNDFIVPDIMFEMKENYINDFSYFSSSELFMEPEINRKGDHSRLGIIGLVGSGVDIKKMSKRKIAVQNVGPTILAYFGDKSMKDRSLL
ncbi:MAG: alkaline phosphatase family protein [Candidatus Micrarchaeota archaeon]|nr:alkaline phosphatase family protein [Candidatus Micrarchaeota archaeon]